MGAEGAYRLHLPRLYGRVLPHKCRAKVNQVCRLLSLFRFTVVHVPAVLPPPPPLPHPLLPPLTPACTTARPTLRRAEGAQGLPAAAQGVRR